MGKYAEKFMGLEGRDDLIAFDYHVIQCELEQKKVNARPEYIRPPYAEMTPELSMRVDAMNNSNMDFWQKLGVCVVLNINPEEQLFFKREMGLCLISDNY